MRRSVVAVALLGLLLTGCGEPTEEEVRADYCALVKERQRALSDRLADRSPTALLEAQPIFRDLAAAAPSEIADQWRVLLDAIGKLDEALAEAGVDPETYNPAKPPAEVTEAQREAIERAAAGLLDPRTQKAVSTVDQQARDVCKTPLFQ